MALSLSLREARLLSGAQCAPKLRNSRAQTATTMATATTVSEASTSRRRSSVEVVRGENKLAPTCKLCFVGKYGMKEAVVSALARAYMRLCRSLGTAPRAFPLFPFSFLSLVSRRRFRIDKTISVLPRNGRHSRKVKLSRSLVSRPEARPRVSQRRRRHRRHSFCWLTANCFYLTIEKQSDSARDGLFKINADVRDV